MKRRYLSRYKIIPFSIILLLFAGCNLWQNFTTYFNLYYNTKTLFSEAEDEIFLQKRDLFETEPLVIPGTASTKLTKVIEKSSKILQFNSNSDYVDDALLMLGKSFYYQKNYQKSKRKFEELLATNPEDDMKMEAEYWIAKCQMSLRDFVNGLTMLEKVRTDAITADYEEIIRGTYIEEIVYRITREDFSLAINLAEQMIPYSNSEMKSGVYFELGKLYTSINDLENAIISYENVFEYSPDFDLEIAANINYAVALRKAGRDEEALSVFEDMRSKDKFTDKFSEIDLETGVTLDKLGKYQEALDMFTLIDTTYKNTPAAAASNYFKGKIYQTSLFNYDSAGFYYQKAFTSNPPQEYQQDIKDKNQLFSKYFNLRNQINNYDRQLFYAENPEIFVQDSLDYVQDSLKLLSDYLELKELQDIWSNVFTPDSSEIVDSLLVLDSLRIQDSIQVRDSLMNLMNLGSFTDTNEVNLALTEYFRVRDSLHVRDSLMTLIGTGTFLDSNDVNRALEEYFRKKREGESLTTEQKNQLKSQTLAGVNLDSVQFKNNPPRKPTIPIDSVKYLISESQLELGNLFLTEIDLPDSAYNLYINNIERFPNSEFYPNTLYALGSYYLTVDNKLSADSLFRYIYDNYKDKSIVNAAAFKIDLPLVDLEYDPAKKIYADAESLMIAGNYENALKDFLSIYLLYPESSYSPKALYASGWILEKDLKLLDSAAVVYDTLVTRYSSTIFSREVAKKLGGYKQEIYKRQKEEDEAKVLTLKSLESDSLASNLEQDELGLNDPTKDLSNAFNTEQSELLDTEKKEPDELLIAPIINQPEDQAQKTKLEALWNPRKPR